MTKAVVYRTFGDPEIAGAIVDGMSRRVIHLDDGELGAVRAELVRYKEMHRLRVYGDEKWFRNARRELARKYKVKRHGRVYNAILGVYGLIVLCVHEAVQGFGELFRR